MQKLIIDRLLKEEFKHRIWIEDISDIVYR